MTPESEDAVETAADRATERGVSGTPTFVVFDPDSEAAGSLVGAQPIERFDEAIERIKDA